MNLERTFQEMGATAAHHQFGSAAQTTPPGVEWMYIFVAPSFHSTGTFHFMWSTTLGEPPPVNLLSWSRGGLLIGDNYAVWEGSKKTENYPHLVDKGFTPLSLSTLAKFIILLSRVLLSTCGDPHSFPYKVFLVCWFCYYLFVYSWISVLSIEINFMLQNLY